MEFVGTDGTLGFGGSAFAADIELFDFLDDIIDRSRACRIALVVAPWYHAVGHVVGEGPLSSLQGSRSAVGRAVTGGNVVIRITESAKGHEAFDIVGADVQQFGASKCSGPTVGSAAVECCRKPVLELHEATQVEMALLLAWHDPAFGVKINNMLEVLGLEKKKKDCQKEKNS